MNLTLSGYYGSCSFTAVGTFDELDSMLAAADKIRQFCALQGEHQDVSREAQSEVGAKAQPEAEMKVQPEVEAKAQPEASGSTVDMAGLVELVKTVPPAKLPQVVAALKECGATRLLELKQDQYEAFAGRVKQILGA